MSRIPPDGVVDSVFRSDPPLRAPMARLGRHSPEAAGIDVVEQDIRLRESYQRPEYEPNLMWRHSPTNGIHPLDCPVYSVGL